MQSSLADQKQQVKWEANRAEMSPRWFSDPQETQKEAETLHQPGMFELDPAAVYRTHEGKFVMGLLKGSIKHWPPHQEAEAIYDLLGWQMVSCCDPICGIWKDYESEADEFSESE